MVDAQAVQLKAKVYVQGQTNFTETASTIYVYGSLCGCLVVLASLAYVSALTIYHSHLMWLGDEKQIHGESQTSCWSCVMNIYVHHVHLDPCQQYDTHIHPSAQGTNWWWQEEMQDIAHILIQ